MVFTRVEDRPTPPEVYNLRIYLCAIVAATAAIVSKAAYHDTPPLIL